MQVQAASDWYTSDLMWTIVSTLVGLVVGVLGAWATLRSSSPKRRIVYGLSSSTRLLSGVGVQGVAVTHNGSPLAIPYAVTLVIHNTGRHDIVSDMFHNDESVDFEFGNMVVAVLSVQSEPSTTVVPAIEQTDYSTVSLLPCRLARDQKVHVHLLFDGPANSLRVASSLVDVEVRVQYFSGEGRADRESRTRAALHRFVDQLFTPIGTYRP